ncbi:MAG TPA: hypothetical protein VJ947_01055 [Pseudohaliea sp.]|nr:hypothetical protein [Pseudohaliea sp.]
MLLLAGGSAVAEPTAREHNYKVNEGPWLATYRHAEGTWHVEVGRDIAGVEITYRHADLRVTDEDRIKFTHSLWQEGGFSLEHRMEYRKFSAAALDDHWRYRFIINYRQPLSEHLTAWIKLQPRMAFRDDRLFDARDQVGIEFRFGDLRISPFYERYARGSWGNRAGNVFGTHLSLAL